ncbi:5-methyltetrahydropteroyltriglutamate--homocysteine S-methyltransferase [Paracoccus sp. TK19116]|uniref:5-methyltetrahydropteroyltriglutamate--homocysteine S-methyltransferase n=1 Tax=Paracoccus albicereus TaxID=2922394 RepID=A0ABT1MUZ7_9RHOB|nr:5-methyltetrahydropteroyltriglutamate--homocysteine S-methyltransferase [Paracoccus albicereus]MCQ0972125.1 5-methyltetrahydropteroyltriglutamate--homocysteine S-methyltransferase [Paracoccus albicereus]
MKPMFRADHVGSLLRPAPIAKARAEGKTGAALRQIEDAEIPALIAMQEDVGLKVVTDGEARRAYWHYDYMGMLDGLEIFESGGDALGFKGATISLLPRITGPLGFPADHPMLDHFRFVANHTKVTPKISIPGPSAVHFRVTPENIDHEPYRDPEAFMAAIAACYRDAVAGFYAAGCRYLQLDDIFFAYLGDEKQREIRRGMGQDPDWLIDRYAWMLEEAIKDRPADMTIGMHMCRGNFKSTFVATGGYDAAADAIFNRTSVDVYFMEYDTERAGGLEPLGLLPKGSKRVLPGFITTKTAELEDMDMLKRRFDEASKFVSMDQLGIAPQCGFASTEHGNAITPDDQRRKLDLVVRLADELWGDA